MIALVDCNSFFCSCELLFKPEYKNRPVIVLSNNDGCVVARNRKAKELGVAMCAPYFKIKREFEAQGGVSFSSNYALYTDLSRRIMELLSSLVPAIHVYSVDEAFLDLKTISKEKREEFLRMLKMRVERDIGIPVSVGMGRTKVLAKLANEMAKQSKTGIISLDNLEKERWALERTNIGEIWGVGKKSLLKLRELGIKTALDLKEYAHEEKLRDRTSISMVHIKNELSGQEEIKSYRGTKKSITSSRSFERNVYDHQEIHDAMMLHLHDALEEAREQNSLCYAFSIFLWSNPHQPDQPQHTIFRTVNLPTPTSDARTIQQKMNGILKEELQIGIGYKKAGLTLAGLMDASFAPLTLFDSVESLQSGEELMGTIDHINQRFGKRTVTLGANQKRSKLESGKSYQTPAYTTSFQELPKVMR